MAFSPLRSTCLERLQPAIGPSRYNGGRTRPHAWKVPPMDNTLTLPAILEAALAQTLCPEDAERVRTGIADAEERPVTLRANTLLASADEVEAALADAGIRATRVPWYADAFVLDEVRERAVWDLPLYQEGKVKYEKQYGPLEQTSAAQGNRYNWLENPWPWDYVGGSK